MPAYVIIRIQAPEPERLKEYQSVAPAIIDKYRGKILARGGEVLSLEGPEENRRIVIIEFDSLDAAQLFYHSGEYQAAIELRKGIAEFEMIAVDGIR